MIFNYFVVPDVITKEECEKLISVLRYNVKDSCVAEPNPNPNISGTIHRGIRNSKSCFVDYGTFLNPILRKIQIAFREVAFSFYRFPICYMEDFSYTEYEENMYYDWHADSGMEPTDIDLTDEQESELDVLMNLEAEAVRGK